MSGAKRFTDFCAGFAAFSAIIYLFSQYMGYDFEEIEGTTEKLKYFFSTEPHKDYSFYLWLIGLFIFSCVFSTVFNKLPWLTLAVSALPMIQTIAMFAGNYIYERPMIYVILGAAHMCGCLFECIRRDRLDRKRRSALAADLLALSVVAFVIFVFYTVKKMPEAEFTELNFYERRLYYIYKDLDLTVFKHTAICFAILPIVRLIHRDVYFIDAALSLVPFVYLTYMWNADKIPVFGEVLVTLSLAYAIARISIALICKPKPIEKKKRRIKNVQ